MKDEIINTSSENESTGFFLIEINTIKVITDLEALGMYTYMKMLIEQGITKCVVILDLISKNFSISENHALKKLKILDDLGIMVVVKTKE
jgi:hypothetical protein